MKEIEHYDDILLMIKSLRIENFRCFQQLDLNDFGQINVIVGTNGGGKTALLESLFLPGGAPDLALKLNAWRGLSFGAIGETDYESLWIDLFFRFSKTTPIKITVSGDSNNHRALEISFSERQANNNVITPPPASAPQLWQSSRSLLMPLTFKTKDSSGQSSVIQAIRRSDGIIYGEGDAAIPSRIKMFPATHAVTASETANEYSNLSKRNDEVVIVETIRSVFPAVQGISVETFSTGVSLFCTIEGVAGKVSLGHVSTGLSRLAGYLVGIASTSNGVVLIDEIENGFHYTVFPKVWEALVAFAEKYNTQLFLSTHSREYLEALVPLMNTKGKEKFRLIRPEGKAGGGRTAKIFKGKDFESALETGVEFR